MARQPGVQIEVQIDRTSPVPLYHQLAQQLAAAVTAGRLQPGDPFENEVALGERLGLSRPTVRRAFQDLVAEGVVYRVPGRGTYANESGRYLRQLGSIEDLMSLSDDTTMEVLSGLRRRVDVETASRLRLDDDVVYSVAFRRLHDGVPFVVTRVHLPEPVARLVADAAELRDGASSTSTVIALLEPRLDDSITEAAQSITVAPADDAVAVGVGCMPGHSMLRVDRLYSDASGTPVELAVSHFLPEQYTYRVTLRRSS